jgi:hypothetical protein
MYSFGPQKNESSTCTIKNVSDNENINLQMPSFLWQGKTNRASKIKRLLAWHSAVKVTHFLELVTVTFPKKELVTGKSYT